MATFFWCSVLFLIIFPYPIQIEKILELHVQIPMNERLDTVSDKAASSLTYSSHFLGYGQWKIFFYDLLHLFKLFFHLSH